VAGESRRIGGGGGGGKGSPYSGGSTHPKGVRVRYKRECFLMPVVYNQGVWEFFV